MYILKFEWDPDKAVWELYNVDEDFSENRDLAARFPEKLRELQDLWWTEAGKYQVLPLDARGPERIADPRPQPSAARSQYVYWPGGAPVPEAVAVNVKNRSHVITAHVVIPKGGAEGVLLAHGGRFGGYTFFVKDGRLHYVHNYCDVERELVRSDVPLPAGPCTVAFEFRTRGAPQIARGLGSPGVGRLYINGKKVGEAEIAKTTPICFSLTGEGLCIGYDSGIAVSDAYRSPFPFTGTITKVVVDVSGERYLSPDIEHRIAMAVQ